MGTRLGFNICVGAFLGVFIGTQLPFAASLEALAGAGIGIALALWGDKKARNNKE